MALLIYIKTDLLKMRNQKITYFSTSDCFETFVTAAIYFIIILEASVFPAPLSPVRKYKFNNIKYKVKLN